jgi:hypothetical protein
MKNEVSPFIIELPYEYIIELTNELYFITWGELTRELYLKQYVYWPVLSVATVDVHTEPLFSN